MKLNLMSIHEMLDTLGLVLTNVHQQVSFNYIPEIEPDELVDVYDIQKESNPTGEETVQCMIVVQANGDAWIIGCLESSRYDRAWKFLSAEDYEHYYKDILPRYNVVNIHKFMATPVMSNVTETNVREFYYYDKIHFPNVESPEIHDNILLTTIGDMVYCIALYKSLITAHWDRGLNRWASDVELIQSISGGKAEIRCVKNGMLYVEHVAFNQGFIIHNNRAYMPIGRLPHNAGATHYMLSPNNISFNNGALATFNDHFKMLHFSINVAIINHDSKGPLKEMYSIVAENTIPVANGGSYSLLVVEVTPFYQNANLITMMGHFFNCSTSAGFQSINIHTTPLNMNKWPEGAKQHIRVTSGPETPISNAKVDVKPKISDKATSLPNMDFFDVGSIKPS